MLSAAPSPSTDLYSTSSRVKLHECLLERRLNRRQLVQNDLVRSGDLADLLRGQPVHFDHARLAARHRDVRPEDQLAQARSLRRTHPHPCTGCLPDELVDAHVGDQPAAPDHDQMIGRQRHLAHQVRRDEHRPTLCRQLPEQVANPMHLPGRARSPARRASPSPDRRATPPRSRAADPCRARTAPPASAQRRGDRRDRSTRSRGCARCRASARARADGCRPSGPYEPTAPRAARRPRAAAA